MTRAWQRTVNRIRTRIRIEHERGDAAIAESHRRARRAALAADITDFESWQRRLVHFTDGQGQPLPQPMTTAEACEAGIPLFDDEDGGR